jgi:cysteine sulfinate desulfinase/cysteine desulfurase-like protein
LVAQGATAAQANALLRFSLGRENTAADLEQVQAVLPKVISRAAGGAGHA